MFSRTTALNRSSLAAKRSYKGPLETPARAGHVIEPRAGVAALFEQIERGGKQFGWAGFLAAFPAGAGVGEGVIVVNPRLVDFD